MKYIIPVGRKDTLLALANKRTETICKLMDNNHVDGLEDILRLVDRPVGTPEEIRNATEDQHINAILDCDTEEAKRLMEVINQAMKEYI